PLAQAPGAVGEVQTSYHGLIDAVRPAVVSIAAAMRNVPNVATQGMNDPFPADVAFNRIGSGVIIDPRGYLLSSYHVIAGAEALKATVYGPGGATEYPLKMVKGDLRTDMALLRIQGSGPFPHASLGNSDAARTGDMVLTIGSPFGFEQTVTSGMISSRNRTLQIGDTVYENLIQTDSAINSGSSGGPMLNVTGEVIGINTAIFAPTGVFNGIGFAIPINRAAELVGGVIDFNNTAPGAAGGQLVAWSSQGRQVGNNYRLPNGQTVIAPHGPLGACVDCHPQLFEQQAPAATPAAFIAPSGMPYGPGSGRGGGFYGRGQMQGAPYYGAGQQMAYNEPIMGVNLIDVDDIICRQAQMLHPEGVLVTIVTPGGPAAAAGVQRGDILVRISGRKILNIADLNTLLSAQKIGSRFELVYLRNGSRQAVRIRTGGR
ncbi:MAG: trypsin-like peptidase domain-containing protein, partial [Deltaproteobacteria bacterium]